jgi:hypothetical protein
MRARSQFDTVAQITQQGNPVAKPERVTVDTRAEYRVIHEKTGMLRPQAAVAEPFQQPVKCCNRVVAGNANLTGVAALPRLKLLRLNLNRQSVLFRWPVTRSQLRKCG